MAKKGQKHYRKWEAAVAKATTRLGRQKARLARGQASCKPKGRSRYLSPTAHILAPRTGARDGRGGSHEEFPSPPGRSWLLAVARGGLGQQARASNPNLGKGRKVELRTGKQLFTALLGSQEQSRVAGIGSGAAGSGALKGRLLTRSVRWGLFWERRQPLRSQAAPLQHTAAGMLGLASHSAAVLCFRVLQGCSSKKCPSLGQTGVCQAEPVHGCMGSANTAATLLGMWDFLSSLP